MGASKTHNFAPFSSSYHISLSCIAGFALATGSPSRFACALALSFVLGLKATEEERALKELHGATYDQYAARTPQLLPTWAGVAKAAVYALGGAVEAASTPGGPRGEKGGGDRVGGAIDAATQAR